MNKKILALFLLFLSSKVSLGEKHYNFVKDFGGNGNGKFCNYVAFQKMAKFLSDKSNIIIDFPKGIYYINKYIINPCTSNENIDCVNEIKGNGISNIFIKNANFITVNGNGSTITINGRFTRKKDYKLKLHTYAYSLTTTVTPFFFINCNNLVVNNLNINGGLDSMKKEKNVVEGFSSGIIINDIDNNSNSSSNILISNVNVTKFNNDGLTILSFGENIVVENSIFSYNARQGISIISGKNIKVKNCKLINTGQHKYGNHAPSAGIDIEYEGVGKIEGVIIEKCLIANNKGFQIVATGAKNISISNCVILDETNGYSSPLNGIGIYTDSTTLNNNIIYASLQIDLGSIKLENNRVFNIEKNIIYSGYQGGASGILSDDMNTPCSIKENWFIMLPIKDTLKEVLFPLIRNSNLIFEKNKIFIHPSSIPQNSKKYVSHPQHMKTMSNNMWLINNSKDDKEFKIAYNGSGETTKFANEFRESKNSIIAYKVNNKKIQIIKTNAYKKIFIKDIFTAKKMLRSTDKLKALYVLLNEKENLNIFLNKFLINL